MRDEIRKGDTVLCLHGAQTRCPVHTEETVGPDQHEHMVGQLYTVEAVGVVGFSKCVGVIKLVGVSEIWCLGCFEKVIRQ